MTKSPTLDDVAKQAGVSTATVSLVVNRRPGPKEQTARAIQRVIDELGYVAPPAGRPRGRRDRGPRATHRIALVVGGIAQSHLSAPVYMDVLRGVEAGVRGHGKSLVMNHLPPGEGTPAAVLPQRVDGVVLFGTDNNCALLQDQLRDVPCVRLMGGIDESQEWDHVSYDNRRVGRIAARHLLSRGHRRAVFINASDQDFMLQRGRVFEQAFAAGGGSVIQRTDPELLDSHGSTQHGCLERMRALIRSLLSCDEAPTAAFLSADTLAPVFTSAMQLEAGTPQAWLDVVSCNNEQLLLAHLHPRPATIDIHAQRVGRRALDQLIWRMAHPDEPRMTLALEPRLMAGSS